MYHVECFIRNPTSMKNSTIFTQVLVIRKDEHQIFPSVSNHRIFFLRNQISQKEKAEHDKQR